MAESKDNSIGSEMKKEFSRRGKRPELLPPDAVRYLHQVAKESANKESILSLMKNISNHKLFASKTAFSKLKRTTIPELIFEESAKDKYILVRVIEKWYMHSPISWNTVIEDHEGHVIGFGLYNYPLDEMFSPGDVIVIKEPYLKQAADEMPFIRCDSPTDIIVLRPGHPFYKDLTKGVKWQNDVKVNDAITDLSNGFSVLGQRSVMRDVYNVGLLMCSGDDDPMFKDQQLKLLTVQFELGYFEWVVENGEKFLQKFPEEKKAYFALGKAYYVLRNYEKAVETFDKLDEKFRFDPITIHEVARSMERTLESRGNFELDRLCEISLAKPFERIDCADFCFLVKIIKVPGKGRGLVLTRDVYEGETLLLSKALVCVLDAHLIPGVQDDPGKKAELERIQVIGQLTRLIARNPKLIGAQVYDLYSGENSNQPTQLFCDPDLKNEPICDVELIKNIIACNSFKIVQVMPSGETKYKGIGLFLLPSYINHSCSPNANIEFYNDIMVVTALKEMKKGTELTVSYVPSHISFEERTELIKNRGFQCMCEKCKRRR